MSFTIKIVTIIDPWPLEVGFVETVYTVSEGVGSVEVCVNLTQPQVDILDHYVVVEVIDFPFSVYIPENITLASESPKLNIVYSTRLV